jgi:hypothetical protein
MRKVEEQHDRHCILNVNWEPWRIEWMRDGYIGVGSGARTKVANLKTHDWDRYCDQAAAWLKDESARLAAREEEHKRWREREEARIWREAREMARQMMAEERLLASGYGPIDDLEDEVVLVDLEFTDPDPILAVDRQTFHFERLEA